MLIAFVSDIHANLEALSSLEKDLARADLVVCLGDYVGYYCQVNEAIDFVRGLNAICVQGNHDHFLLEGCPDDASPAVRFGIDYARSVITPENLGWLSGLPLIWGGMVRGVSLLACHGSPWDPIGDYLYQDNPALAGLEAFRYDVVAFGQTHRALLRDGRRPLLLNPGSVGQSRDVKAKACATLLDTSAVAVTKIERAYDVSVVMEMGRRNGAGEWITNHLV